MFSAEAWEFYKRVGLLISLSGAVVAVALYFFNQNRRLSTLESQMLAITTTSATYADDFAYPTKRPSDDQQPRDSKPAVNPIQQVCAELAVKLASKAVVSAFDPIATTMERLNCRQFAK